ncbi:hypothetical protein IQ247_21695 [Plectonema cf. radiosum LEGE 06105]|uniref:Uncharacterized protein n=1 Tax=Plectonema cf. radiosum LEGE 06105 TaxID=945769 RepID=A0A8J7FEY2_9CYAN|nr:hypothetical protein [Plectonema radiosum]MBE9215243.1 hypothetical protein [Plectonema cf. radiosum LEGE 06105]
MKLMTTSVQKTLEIQEIGIVITAKKLNVSILSVEFLKTSGIIAQEWELQSKPVKTPSAVQLSFKNGVNLVAQPGRIIFSETIAKKAIKDIQISEVAGKYIEKLPHADYQEVVVNPKSLIGLENSFSDYITQTLIAPGPWQNIGKEKIQASINFLFQLESAPLSLSITQAQIKQDEKSLPALLFSGSFHYRVNNDSPTEIISQMVQHINQWQTNLTTFNEIVNQKFLGQADSVFNN